MLSVSLLETVEHSNKMVFITLQNNQILRTSGVNVYETGSATLGFYSMVLRSLLCVLHGQYFLPHRKLEVTVETQTEISINECFLSCSLCTLSPHVSLGVVSTNPSPSPYSLLITVSVLQTRTQIHKEKLPYLCSQI